MCTSVSSADKKILILKEVVAHDACVNSCREQLRMEKELTEDVRALQVAWGV